MKKPREETRCGFCGHFEDAHSGEIVPGGLAFTALRPCRCGRCPNFVAAKLPGAAR
jgi:hypothetical protein